MVKRQTVFIIGAGASVPYGFPSGQALLSTARTLDFMNLHSKTCGEGHDAEVHALHDALQRAHDSSLDALLELRPDITAIGKRLIASLLLELEFHSPGRFPKPADDWITIFFEELVRGARSLKEFADANTTSILTFNYDRLLELRLTGALQAHFGAPREQCIEAVKQLGPIHLHGDLGPLDGFSDESVPFGPSPSAREPWRKYIDRAAARVVIVHEAKAETPEFKAARRLLGRAEQVVMLGFGFGDSNVRRLEPKTWIKTNKISATAYGMSPSRIDFTALKPFRSAGRNLGLAKSDVSCREFLDQTLEIFRR